MEPIEIENPPQTFDEFLSVLAKSILAGAPQPSAHDVATLDAILSGDGTHFSAHMFRLIKRADQSHRERLRMVYPHHVYEIEKWEAR